MRQVYGKSSDSPRSFACCTATAYVVIVLDLSAAQALFSPQMADNRQNDDKPNVWIQVGRYSQLAFAMPAATVVGWIIGLLLDKWLHTTHLYLVGLLLGIVAGFVELIRTVMKSENSE
jgi:F0F1-type ATP synthase assembly protein I